jgi:hypothetical protein
MLPTIKNSRLLEAGMLLALGSFLLTGCQSVEIIEPVAIGYVSNSLGFPVVNRNNHRYILARQSQIYPADIFDTDGSSMIEMTLLDQTIITIAKNSHVVLHNYLGDDNSSSMDLNLGKGAIRADLNARCELELRTPIAVAHLQGGISYAGSVSNTMEIVMLKSGSMEVNNDNGEVEIRTAGYGTTVISGSAPQAPYAWTERRLLRATQATTVQPRQ